MKWIKLAIGLTIVAAIIGALFWGADLSEGKVAQARSAPRANLADLIGQKVGLSGLTVRRIESAYLGVVADQAVAAGAITPDQGNRLRQLAFNAALDNVFHSVAQSAGAGDSDLFEGLTSGRSLAQIAQSNGVARDTLKSRLSDVFQTSIVGQQVTGLLTPTQSALVQSLLIANLDRIIDSAAQPQP